MPDSKLLCANDLNESGTNCRAAGLCRTLKPLPSAHLESGTLPVAGLCRTLPDSDFAGLSRMVVSRNIDESAAGTVGPGIDQIA